MNILGGYFWPPELRFPILLHILCREAITTDVTDISDSVHRQRLKPLQYFGNSICLRLHVRTRWFKVELSYYKFIDL
jgi:hypothetical protein